MPDPFIAICGDRTVAGLHRLSQVAEIEPLAGLSLTTALETEFDTDAHLICYHAIDEHGEPSYMRVNKRGPALGQIRAAGGDLRTSILVLDYDLPDHRAWDGPEEVESFFAGLAEACFEYQAPVPSSVYTTKGGARFIYILTDTVAPEIAEGLVSGLVRDWAEAGLTVDKKCSDWTRLFRLPKVLRDGKRQSAEPWFRLSSTDAVLDPASIKPGDVQKTEEYADLEEVGGDLPTPEEVHALLFEEGKGTREKMTEWQKTAKTWLQGRDAYDVCFSHAPIAEDKGRNNELTRLIGSAVGMLYGRDGASPQGVYAVFFNAIEQLEPDANTPSWNRVAWDLTLRLWNAEAKQRGAAIEKLEEAKAVAEAGIWPRILEKMRLAHPQEASLRSEADDSITWASGRLIAAAPKGLFLMRPDGTYSPYACSPELLQATIRHLKMDGVIETHEIRNRALKPKSAQDLVNRHAVPIHRIECTPNVPHTMIEERGETRALVVKVHQLRDDLEPRADRRVDEWLRMIAGTQFEELQEWLANCLDVGRGICALALVGASGAGKGMLVQGIAECFQNSKPNDDKALGKFNVGLLDNPVIHLDEGIPNANNRDGGRTPDQIIRSMVSGGNIAIEPKGKDVMHAMIYPRVLITANNLDIMAQLCGKKDLNDEDLAAIGQRLLYIDVPKEAARWLALKGNYNFTAGWVAGSGANQHALARHILYLYANRQPVVNTTGRLLVEGSKSNRVVQDYAIRTPAARAVVRALLLMIEGQQTPDGMVIKDGSVHVTPSSICSFYERNLQIFMHLDLAPRTVTQVLRLMYEPESSNLPRVIPGSEMKQRWWKLRLDVLLSEAIAAGYNRRRLEATYAEAHGKVALDLVLARANAAESR